MKKNRKTNKKYVNLFQKGFLFSVKYIVFTKKLKKTTINKKLRTKNFEKQQLLQ